MKYYCTNVLSYKCISRYFRRSAGTPPVQAWAPMYIKTSTQRSKLAQIKKKLNGEK